MIFPLHKLLPIWCLCLMATGLSAQYQISNGSFNTWSYPVQPDAWGTWAAAVSPYNGPLGDSLIRLASRDSVIVDTVRYPTDTVSVRLMVDTINFPTGRVTLAGFISYGGAFYNPSDTPYGISFGYISYPKRPDSLIFDYKFIPAPGVYDSALVVMTMIRFDSAAQAEEWYIDTSWLLDTASSWTYKALPLHYLTSDTMPPDSIQIIFIASVAATLHPGTSLWLDTVHFDASVDVILDTVADTFGVGIAVIRSASGVKAYPNPAAYRLHIVVQPADVGGTAELYDGDGRQLFSGYIDRTDYIVDTRCLPDGVYSLRVHSMDRITVYTGRITIIHSDQ